MGGCQVTTDAIDIDQMLWAKQELEFARAREGLHHFGAAVVRDLAGQPMDYDLLQLSWIAHMNYCWKRNQHAGIFAQSGSSGFLVTLAAWLAGRNYRDQIKLVCASDQQARLCMRAIRGIMKSEIYPQIFPDLEPGERWDDKQMVHERPGHVSEPVIEARGVGAKPAGTVATTLLFNSIVDADCSGSVERRQAHRRLVDELWMSRLTPTGRVLWIAQPINPDDTSYAMRARLDFCWLEQRPKQDASGYEQEVYGGGEDYVTETRADMVRMLGPRTG
jgi:hypothetical protein